MRLSRCEGVRSQGGGGGAGGTRGVIRKAGQAVTVKKRCEKTGPPVT